ncbi:MAG TPA: DUF2917 domain-containing protein [Ramlibacter sp.]|nr:DUF2917 domain-containing protein [Ramlibacter sp.]
MNIRVRAAPVCLPKGQAALLDDARGACVRCRAGSVWVTQERDRRDIVLEPGDSLVLERDGLTVVSALSDSSIDVQPVGSARGLGHAMLSRWRTMWPAGHARQPQPAH